MSAKAIAVYLNKKPGKRMGMSMRGQLYEQDAIIQQLEAYIQTISSIPCCFDGPLRMWLACQANLPPSCPANGKSQAAVFTFNTPPRATRPIALLDPRIYLRTSHSLAPALYVAVLSCERSQHLSLIVGA